MSDRCEDREWVMREDSIKATYNTDDPEKPKESATFYRVYKQYLGGRRSDTLYYKAIFRRKSKIIHREEYRDIDFESAQMMFFRTIRRRSHEQHPFGTFVEQMERKFGHLEV